MKTPILPGTFIAAVSDKAPATTLLHVRLHQVAFYTLPQLSRTSKFVNHDTWKLNDVRALCSFWCHYQHSLCKADVIIDKVTLIEHAPEEEQLSLVAFASVYWN
jgi:hypothetical protein